MNEHDPLRGEWKQPTRLKEFGEQCNPQLEQPWLDHMFFNHSAIDIIAVSRFLMPEFVKYDGGVFLAMRFTQDGFEQWKERNTNLEDIEHLLNHIHVYDVLSESNVTEEEYVILANIIRRCWEIALAASFPDDRFVVEMSNEEADYGPVVTFWKVR